jgi:replication initiation protein RepC
MPENAAVAVACILERAAFISSPGGYLRDLTRKTELGEFSLGPMLMAALKANNESAFKVG